VRGAKGAAALWNCETGQTRPIASAATPDGSKVALTFGPQEAYYLVFDPTKAATKESPQKPVETTTAALNGPWTWRIDAATQPPVPNPVALPPDLTDGVVRGLESWNAHGLEKFSGYVDYSTEFEVTSASKPTRLDLGRVAHLAEVWVNGQNVGARLWAPYAFDITKALKPGKNTLRIRVGNLISNNMGIPSEAGLFGPVTLKKQ
jgi:beta-galactosidase/beta-glucuronidase